MTAFVICVGSSLLSKTVDVTLGGSNLILGTGMKSQIFILRTPAAVKFFLQDCQKMTLA